MRPSRGRRLALAARFAAARFAARFAAMRAAHGALGVQEKTEAERAASGRLTDLLNERAAKQRDLNISRINTGKTGTTFLGGVCLLIAQKLGLFSGDKRHGRVCHMQRHQRVTYYETRRMSRFMLARKRPSCDQFAAVGAGSKGLGMRHGHTLRIALSIGPKSALMQCRAHCTIGLHEWPRFGGAAMLNALQYAGPGRHGSRKVSQFHDPVSGRRRRRARSGRGGAQDAPSGCHPVFDPREMPGARDRLARPRRAARAPHGGRARPRTRPLARPQTPITVTRRGAR